MLPIESHGIRSSVGQCTPRAPLRDVKPIKCAVQTAKTRILGQPHWHALERTPLSFSEVVSSGLAWGIFRLATAPADRPRWCLPFMAVVAASR